MKRLKVLSLAALVAFAACDEGSEPIVEPPITGTVSGVVTIEGTARSGVTVTLSSGATATTDGSGAYSFAGVNAGAYTVTISGFPTDATFSSTTKAATVTSAGQVVTVNFDGAYIRTSAILGAVTAGGKGLAGVSVSIGSASVNTDANGQYAFSGLRAGTYTVTISGFDAGQYTFASTSASVTLGVGESKVASFTGQLLATASITGTVTVDGDPAAGVTATLSTGAVATTNASGVYAFSNLTAGTYTVTISGYAADATFPSVAQTVVITSAGSTVPANFAGSYVKTSAISGTVTVGSTGIGGVTVTLDNGATTNTNAQGVYSFAALRAGTYTVTISGWDAAQYTFSTTSGTATVATGEAAVVNFGGSFLATAKITGSLYLDEAATNNNFDTFTESKLAVAGIKVRAEGGSVNDTVVVETDANGDYTFTDLIQGTYRITIQGVQNAPLNAALPTNVQFSGASNEAVVTVPTGGTSTVNWPFTIKTQAVTAKAYRGTATNPMVSPIAGSVIQFYDTYANALAAGVTGLLGTDTTGTDGAATVRFARTLDKGPGNTARDNIVFARLVSHPADHGSAAPATGVIEVSYPGADSVATAPDIFRAVGTKVKVKLRAMEIDGDSLNGWDVSMRANKDSVGATTYTAATNVNGYVSVTMTALDLAATSDGVLPDTLWFRLADVQPATHTFKQTPAANGGTAAGRFIKYIWDGTANPADSVMLGQENVAYTQQDVTVRVHRELDDSTGVTPLYSSGDNFDNVDLINVSLYRINTDGTKTLVGGPTAAAVGTGLVTFVNADPSKAHEVRAISSAAALTVLGDSVIAVTLDGSDETYTDATLKGTAGSSSWAIKSNTNVISGTVAAADATAGDSVIVTVSPTAGNIQGTPTKVDTTDATGAYSVSGLMEGPYTVTVAPMNSASWQFFNKLSTPLSGSANNSSATEGTRDIQGGGALVANFQVTRMDTKIQGVVVNDRDADGNVIDIDEALSGAQFTLARDTSVALSGKWESTGLTSTSDANGQYSFSALREGRYLVKWVAGTPGSPNLDVLRALSTDSVIVSTAATTTGIGADNTRRVGTTAPTTLPRWDYDASAGVGVLADPAHFMFLYKNTTAKGTVKAGATGIVGMTISLRRCNTSAGATSPPTVGTCTTYLGTTINVVSEAGGAFQFPNLTEGVYEIRPQPTTVAGYNTSVPATALYIVVGNGDIESLDFVIS